MNAAEILNAHPLFARYSFNAVYATNRRANHGLFIDRTYDDGRGRQRVFACDLVTGAAVDGRGLKVDLEDLEVLSEFATHQRSKMDLRALDSLLAAVCAPGAAS